jgi:hypothetical protein
MFGRSSVAADEQVVLQSAVARVVGELERTIVADLGVPLDYLEIRPGTVRQGESFAGTRLAAGWQIGRKTFLVLNAGYCPQGELATMIGASLQFRISPEWRTEASFEPVQTCRATGGRTADETQVGLDLFWERRY